MPCSRASATRARIKPFQHFITHAPWSADRVWRQLRVVIPEREGMLILDATSFPKQGAHSVGVTRQYCGTLGKVANCQVAVTAALWTGARAWMLGAILYLPQTWLTPDARRHAGIPAGVRFQEKWRSALTLLRPVRASGFRITAVLGDAEFGSEPRRGSSTTWWPCQQPHRGRRWSASPIIAGRSSSNTKSSKTNSGSITSRDGRSAAGTAMWS